MLREGRGNNVLRESLWEHCVARKFVKTLCFGERLGNTLLRERFGQHFAEKKIGGTLC